MFQYALAPVLNRGLELLREGYDMEEGDRIALAIGVARFNPLGWDMKKFIETYKYNFPGDDEIMPFMAHLNMVVATPNAKISLAANDE